MASNWDKVERPAQDNGPIDAKIAGNHRRNMGNMKNNQRQRLEGYPEQGARLYGDMVHFTLWPQTGIKSSALLRISLQSLPLVVVHVTHVAAMIACNFGINRSIFLSRAYAV